MRENTPDEVDVVTSIEKEELDGPGTTGTPGTAASPLALILARYEAPTAPEALPSVPADSIPAPEQPPATAPTSTSPAPAVTAEDMAVVRHYLSDPSPAPVSLVEAEVVPLGGRSVAGRLGSWDAKAIDDQKAC